MRSTSPIPIRAAQFVAAAVEALGGLDFLVNNAGGAVGRYPFWESSEDDEEWMIEANVHGLLRMTRLCLPHIRDGGHIVNIDSIAGRGAYENAAVYCTVKAAAAMFSQALREDLLGRPVRVTAVAPGLAGGPSSRSSASRATRRRRRRSTRASSRSPQTTSPTASSSR